MDLSLPLEVFPASNDEAFVVRGTEVGRVVEITLSRDHRHPHMFREDNYEPLETLAVQRFRPGDLAGYTTYAGRLEVAAEYAVRGQLDCYTVNVEVVGEKDVRVSLVGRLLDPDGHVRTEISDERVFTDADSSVALVQANEAAAELESAAQERSDQVAAAREDRLDGLRAQYDQDDAEARAAGELREIVETEVTEGREEP